MKTVKKKIASKWFETSWYNTNLQVISAIIPSHHSVAQLISGNINIRGVSEEFQRLKTNLRKSWNPRVGFLLKLASS